jgi:peptide-methionine (R)-S-oxide reductase
MTNRLDDLKHRLSEVQYRVTQEAATERPFTGEYWDHWQDGRYKCICCNEPLFDSAHKFDAGCGWPSFDQELTKGKVEERFDSSHGMRRTEVVCANCKAHLGHVFPDGPTETTGMRYCINSASLSFNGNESDD